MKYNVTKGKNPTTKVDMYYAAIAPVNVITFETLTEMISAECTVTPHDTRAVLSALQEKIIEQLMLGCSVRLGLLGSFRPTLNSVSAETKEEFTVSNIKRINVVYTPSTTIKYKLSASNPNIHFEEMN